jgi:hypothetical protein
MIDIEKTIEAADAEMKKFEGAEVVLKFPLIKAVNLCSLIQLALRHEEIPELSRANGRKFCDELIELVGRASPLLADFMRLGDNPKYDQKKPIDLGGTLSDMDRLLIFFHCLSEPPREREKVVKLFCRITGMDKLRAEMAFDEAVLRDFVGNKPEL